MQIKIQMPGSKLRVEFMTRRKPFRTAGGVGLEGMGLSKEGVTAKENGATGRQKRVNAVETGGADQRVNSPAVTIHLPCGGTPAARFRESYGRERVANLQ